MPKHPEINFDSESYPQPLPAAGDQIFRKSVHPYRQFYEEFYRMDLTYLDGYRVAANLLYEQAERTLAQNPNASLDVANWLVYPIYFLYRHTIELALKQIRDGMPIKPAQGSDYHHDLSKLWTDVKVYVHAIGGDRLHAEADAFETLINQLHRVDPRGDAGRYDLHKNRSASFKAVRPIDLPNLRETLNKMVNFLTWVRTLQRNRP